jgi:hypothetical protein
VLTNLLEVAQTGLLALEDGAHPSQRGALEALASVEGVSVLDHADHVTGYGVDEGFGGVDLAEGQLVVVAVVEGVAEIRVEGVDVREAGEVG